MSGLILYTTEDGQSRIQLRARRRQDIPMRFWRDNVGQIISSDGLHLPQNAGSTSHEQMEAHTSERYLAFDEQRKQQEAQAADAADEAELTALENKLKRRPKP